MTAVDLRHVIYVVLLAASPLAEMRGSIPVSVAVFKMSVPAAIFWSVFGNMLVLPLIYGLGDFWLGLMRDKKHFLARMTDGVVHHSRHKFEAKLKKYGMFAFPLIVAIPLPLFGMWTAALAAFLVGIPFKKAFILGLPAAIVGALVILAATSGSIALLAK